MTIKNWFEDVLKEGMTVFREQEFSYSIWPREIQRISNVRRVKVDVFPIENLPRPRPVRLSEYKVAEETFDGPANYVKAPETKRMLYELLGHKKFMKGIIKFLRAFDGDAASIDDMLSVFKELYPKEIDYNKFRKWYDEGGTSKVLVQKKYNAKRNIFTLKVYQNLDRYFPLKIGLLNNRGKEMIQETLHISKKKHVFKFRVKQAPYLSLH